MLRFLPAGEAYAGLSNVDSTSGSKFDHMESFWFAEVLKYLYAALNPSTNIIEPFFSYLTFDDPNHISLDDCEVLPPSPFA